MAYDSRFQAADAAHRAGIERPTIYEVENDRWDYERPYPCEQCEGTGVIVAVLTNRYPCGRCKGTGVEYA